MQRSIPQKSISKFQQKPKSYQLSSRKAGKENRGHIQKTENKMVDLKPTMSVTALNVKDTHWVMKHFPPNSARTENPYRKY